MEFMGYRRSDGRVGVRNHVLIMPCSICATDTARMVYNKVEGAAFINNHLGCSQVPKDLQYTIDGLAGIAANPNVYGTIIIEIGCESCQASILIEEIRRRTNKPFEVFTINKEGSVKTVEKAVEATKKMIEESKSAVREKFPLSELVLATECGGSDPTSGLAANPVIGEASDLLIRNGGTSILSETTELIGAEHILASRAKDEQVKDRIYELVNRYERHLQMIGEDIRRGNPTPGNKAGGITTLEEKSLGCIYKGGKSPVNAVYDYAKQLDPAVKGLVIMDTPGTDAPSIAAMLAGGAQVIVYSSGLGSPLGSPIAPVIKITGNRDTYHRMFDNTDFDASPALFGEKSIEQLGLQLFNEVVEVANGKTTKAEQLGFTETTFMRACNFV